VNKTLYIPLYGKAFVSRKGILLNDPKAEKIWAAEGFPLKGKSSSKWLAYYMGMRAAVFDRWLKARIEADPSASVVHIGCGMDSRCDRVGSWGGTWFDVDFPEVIQERSRYYQEDDSYKMLSADVRSADWLERLPEGNAIIVMEGVSMYLTPEELQQLLERLAAHFEGVHLLVDCYTQFAAKASKVKNPINDVGVTRVYGLDDPKVLEKSGFVFARELEMTPQELIGQLQGVERKIFQTLYGGSIARKMYRLYEYEHAGAKKIVPPIGECAE
jgi:O-methyltransferase involved in polyketide biosynthesis